MALCKKIILCFFVVFLCSCNTIEQTIKKKNEIENKIGEEKKYRVDQASGAVYATRVILEDSEDTPNTVAAKKTINIAEKSLPDLSIEDQKKWEEISKEIKENPKSLNRIEKKLTKSEKRESKLQEDLEEITEKLFYVYDKDKEKSEDALKEAKSNKKLLSKLSMYFAGAAVLCVLGSLLIGHFLGFRVALNGFIAGGFFGLASYLVTQTFFAYIAGLVAVIMVSGTIYYIWGRVKPERAVKKTVDVIEKLEKSEDPEKREAAKILKKEMSFSLTGKEAESHKKYIKDVKKKL